MTPATLSSVEVCMILDTNGIFYLPYTKDMVIENEILNGIFEITKDKYNLKYILGWDDDLKIRLFTCIDEYYTSVLKLKNHDINMIKIIALQVFKNMHTFLFRKNSVLFVLDAERDYIIDDLFIITLDSKILKLGVYIVAFS